MSRSDEEEEHENVIIEGIEKKKKNKILLTASYNRGTQRLFSVKYLFGAATIA